MGVAISSWLSFCITCRCSWWCRRSPMSQWLLFVPDKMNAHLQSTSLVFNKRYSSYLSNYIFIFFTHLCFLWCITLNWRMKVIIVNGNNYYYFKVFDVILTNKFIYRIDKWPWVGDVWYFIYIFILKENHCF